MHFYKKLNQTHPKFKGSSSNFKGFRRYFGHFQVLWGNFGYCFRFFGYLGNFLCFRVISDFFLLVLGSFDHFFGSKGILIIFRS